MNRTLRILARLLPGFCVLLAILTPLVTIWVLWIVSPGFLTKVLHISEVTLSQDFGWWPRCVMVLIGLLPAACLSYGLLNARSALARFSRGEFFSAAAIRGIRGFGAGVFWSGVLAIAIQPVALTVITLFLDASPPQWSMLINVDTATLVMLTIGGILWQIASMMQRGADLAEENRQFV
jgi:hypothetical protein